MRRITTRNARRLFRLPSEDTSGPPVYEIRGRAYVNVTNACDARCVFCPRTHDDYEVKGHDLRRAKELAPRGIHYAHDTRWGDGNGFAHVRAALMGPSVCVPFADGELLLGTWQQIVVVDFDNRPRTRGLVIQVLGG